MCLTIPAKVISAKGKGAVVESGGKKKEVKTDFVRVKKGDYVLLQAGFVVQKLGKKEAEDWLKLLKTGSKSSRRS